MLLDTVRSRCPRLRLGHLGVDEVAGILMRGSGFDARAARAAVAAAGGSAGRALQLASSDREGTREAAVGLLRSVSAARDARACLDGARAFAAGKARSARRPPTGGSCGRWLRCCATSR